LILFNIDVTTDTLPYIIKSIRDPDDINRRVVYLKPLSSLDDFRQLNFEERQEVLKWGLNDRNELVRKAATKMFAENWIKHAGRNLIEFLERLEATKPAMSDLIEKLFKEFFKIRSDVFKETVFDDEFWSNLSGESALLARMMIEYLQNEDEEDERLDKILPSVTVHVMNLENYYNLYQQYNNADDNSFNYEYIIVQMLDIALCLDYADEMGRKKMYNLLRDILRSYEVIDEHLERILKVFRRISIDERDFTRYIFDTAFCLICRCTKFHARSIIEIISDIQEEAAVPYLDMEDDVTTKKAKLDENSTNSPIAETPKSTTNTEEIDNSQDVASQDLDKLVAKLRCLNICKRMLENSYEPLTDNSILYGLLNDLIVPAVQDGDSLLRQEGLHCLGLCCTLDKGLAQHNVALFINCIKNGHEVLVKKAVRVSFIFIL
jgi:condensin complex subunit 3